MKICEICTKEYQPYHKSIERQRFCSDCVSLGNKVRGKEHTIKRRKRRGRLLDKYKLSKGCQLCGYKDNLFALQWDHINPSEKHATVSTLMTGDIKKLFKEIRKCRVLCANCHAIHTYSNKHSWRKSTLTDAFLGKLY